MGVERRARGSVGFFFSPTGPRPTHSEAECGTVVGGVMNVRGCVELGV